MRTATSPSDSAAELINLLPADTDLPEGLDSINLTLNRRRLKKFLDTFSFDSDLQDYLVLDVIAGAVGADISSTGELHDASYLASRPFRLWEYVWLHKLLQFSDGGRSVLDLGGPASHLTISAALAGNDVLSIDVNPQIVEAGRRCASAFQLNTYRAEVGDMRDLSRIAPGSVDRIVCCSVLEHLTADDQRCAISEMARVLLPGGIIGLTFDYGLPAPGANSHLPPPHDPPQSVAEVTARFVQKGLDILGESALEDPIPGSLFATQEVSYTVASLFLGKSPLSDPPVPAPMWSSRRAVARFSTRDLMQRAAQNTQPEQLQQVGRAAEERLEALLRADEIIQTKEGQLQEVQRIAEEHLESARRADCVLKEQERAMELHLVALSNAKDALSKTEARADRLRRTVSEFGQESIIDFLLRRCRKALRRG
jgi:SAM-dependent methyltransferase